MTKDISEAMASKDPMILTACILFCRGAELATPKDRLLPISQSSEEIQGISHLENLEFGRRTELHAGDTAEGRNNYLDQDSLCSALCQAV